MSDRISVNIVGGEREERELIGNIINNALFDSGFRDLSTDVPMHFDQMPSMLDLMKQNNPELFQREVFIRTTPIELSKEKINEIAQRAAQAAADSFSAGSLVETAKGVLGQLNQQLLDAGVNDVAVSATLEDGTVVNL